MAAPEKDTELGISSMLYTGGEPQTTASTYFSPESLASLHADFNCRGDDGNDCIKRLEVDEKVCFTKTPRREPDGQGQKAVGSQGHEKQLFVIMAT